MGDVLVLVCLSGGKRRLQGGDRDGAGGRRHVTKPLLLQEEGQFSVPLLVLSALSGVKENAAEVKQGHLLGQRWPGEPFVLETAVKHSLPSVTS